MVSWTMARPPACSSSESCTAKRRCWRSRRPTRTPPDSICGIRSCEPKASVTVFPYAKALDGLDRATQTRPMSLVIHDDLRPTIHETKRRLLEAGLSMLLERGYSGLGVQDVLDRTSIPKGSFYHHFES